MARSLRRLVFDMKVEQTRDDEISEIRSMILNGKECKDVQRHYLLINGLVYYISNVNGDPCLRLFIPKHLRNFFCNSITIKMDIWVWRKLLILYIRSIIGQIYSKK